MNEEKMSLEEAIEICNRLKDDPLIKKHDQARSVALEGMGRKPKSEYYKSSKKYDYYIELPYEELWLSSEKGLYWKHHYYSAVGIGVENSKYSGSSTNLCLSLCGYTREKMEKRLDRRIQWDNEDEEQ